MVRNVTLFGVATWPKQVMTSTSPPIFLRGSDIIVSLSISDQWLAFIAHCQFCANLKFPVFPQEVSDLRQWILYKRIQFYDRQIFSHSHLVHDFHERIKTETVFCEPRWLLSNTRHFLIVPNPCWTCEKVPCQTIFFGGHDKLPLVRYWWWQRIFSSRYFPLWVPACTDKLHSHG